MRKLYVILCLLLTLNLSAQQANDWIKFNGNLPYSSQQYFKIKVWKNGIYKLDYNILQAVGFPLSADPMGIQIFHNGKEQYIFVQGESDTHFDPTDYIEFYGQRNDGAVDKILYDNPSDQLNPNYSLFCDTAVYFLTVPVIPTGIIPKRMLIETDVNFGAYTPKDYITREVRRDYLGEYLNGDSEGDVDPSFTGPEGFSGTAFDISTSDNFSTPNISTASSAFVPFANLRMVNANDDNAYHTFNVNLNSSPVFSDNTIIHYDRHDYNFNISAASLTASNTIVYSGFVNTAGVNRMSVTYLNLRYAHANTFSGETDAFQHFFTSGISPKVRVDLDDYMASDNGIRYVYLLEGDTVRRINTLRTGNLVQALIPVNGNERECVLASSTLSYTTTADFLIAPINNNPDPNAFARFTNYNNNAPNNYDYLMVSHKSLWSEAINYKNFRSTDHSPLLVDIDELYDQFAFGVYKHPLAIKNFCRYSIQNFAQVKYLLLVGKAVYPKDVRTSAADAAIDLVPTYGSPPSDFMFSNRIINDTTFVPALATGRIAAWNSTDIATYAAKIQEHEAAQQACPEDWMKHILHFVGGSAGFEQAQIRSYMDPNESIIEDTLIGGIVTSYYKTSTDPIQYLQALELQARIDSGVSIMNFFGHAAGSSFDITTDAPQNWHNQGRYPMVFAQSCLVGDIYGPTRNLNEEFVLLANKGSVGFLAKPYRGNIDELGKYSTYLYQNIAYKDFAKGIGVAALHASDSLLQEFYSGSGISYKSTALGMLLHGDPALTLVPDTLPDLMIAQPSVYFSPTEVTTDLNSFDVNVIVTNLGKAIFDSINVRVVRKFPDGSPSITIDSLISYVAYKDTIKFTFPIQSNSAAGINNFDVFVNYLSGVQECRNGNNSLFNVPLQILSTDITPVYPFKYAIVPDTNVILKASIDNIFATSKTYRFELDTTDSFNTPFLRTTTITQTGGVVKWPLPFTCDSGKVYYWRVSLDPSLYPGNYKWKESSFVFMPAKTGWSQAHFFQFKNDKYTNIIYNKPQRIWEFDSTKAELRANNWKSPAQGIYSDNVFLNNELIATGGCNYDGFHVMVFDSISLSHWQSDQYNYGQINNPPYNNNCPTNPGVQGFYFFSSDNNYALHPNTMDSMANMLANVDPGNYVLIYSIRFHHVSPWPSTLINQLTISGFPAANTIPSARPFIFFYKKGDQSSALQSVAPDDTTQQVFLNTFIGGNWYKGFMTSEIIGPAVQWNSLHWDNNSIEAINTDRLSLDLIGLDVSDHETVLYTGIQPSSQDFILNINANVYPRLFMRAYIEDSVYRTPAQMKYWQIYYQEVPESVVNPYGSEFSSADLSQGDSVYWKMPVENVSNTGMSDMLVDFYLYDKDNIKRSIASPRFHSLLAGDTLNAVINFSTSSYPGLNALWMEVNPRNDQPEQFHYNNFAKISFNVNRDVTNPILDVTFDGQHILNGDYVSGKPQIAIRLKDENKYLALNDTSKYKVFLKSPGQDNKQIYFEPSQTTSSNPDLLKWIPAQLPDNTFRIEYNPILSEDGTYELSAQARDESGNLSGNTEYRISFDVVNKSYITNVLNYPNPFTTQTRFVFTLTGSEIPTYFKIQIINISGKTIREITQNEIGPIHIGRNITEYAWDGKDQFGDQLAKGVYLYRVITQIDGSDIEKWDDSKFSDKNYSAATNKYFRKGWGKMYLLK